MRVKPTWALRAATLALAALAAVSTLPASAGNPVSEWKPGCYIDGHPIDLTYFFCNTGHFNGRFDGAPNNSFFFNAGASLNLAIYGSSEQGFRLWGPIFGTETARFEEIGPSEVRGSGAPDDPFEHRGVFAAGDPRQLLVHAYSEYVNGRKTFETRWEITNISTAPVNFRATVFADTDIHGQCAYGDVQSGPRAVGSFTPVEGAPYEPNDCYFTERDRGFSAYAIEQAVSPWSAYQQGDAIEIEGRIEDASGPGLANTHDPRPIPEALAIQWDDYGQGRRALAPGEQATFALTWRFTSELLVTPFRAVSPDAVHQVSLSTRFARGGPLRGQRLAYEIYRDDATTRGSVVTDDRGVAQVTWRQKDQDYDGFSVSFDANGDGRIQESSELYRMGVMVSWGPRRGYHRTRLSFGRVAAGFAGRVAAIHEDDPEFGHDCRAFRTIAVRRRIEGRDPSLGSAASNRNGVWNLEVSAPPGDYYGVVLPEWRSPLGGAGYRCRGARAG